MVHSDTNVHLVSYAQANRRGSSAHVATVACTQPIRNAYHGVCNCIAIQEVGAVGAEVQSKWPRHERIGAAVGA